jgi:hypothetical protein
MVSSVTTVGMVSSVTTVGMVWFINDFFCNYSRDGLVGLVY